jgi:very-short-patch-repair endonuclease
LFFTRLNSSLVSSYIDDLYLLTKSEEERRLQIQSIKAKASSEYNLQYEQSLPEEVKQQRADHLRSARSLRKTIGSPGIAPWNKGKTKETDKRLKQNSEARMGSNNPMFGVFPSEEQKQRQSKEVKARILEGTWTPHVHNSRTHFDTVVDGKAYRSSWEALFHSLNKHMRYEATRIQYTFEGQQRIYIVDFTDDTTKQLIEIRPQERSTDDKTRAKIEAATLWAKENGFSFMLISQQWFKDNIRRIPAAVVDQIPNSKQKLSQFYEN